jgi:hypothetical protein
MSGSAANVRLMCHVCNLLLIVCAGDMTINILPDNVLLHIFLFDEQEYHEFPSVHLVGLEDGDRVERLPWRWHRLVHVCRRWRSIVFASPNFLDLRIVCGPRNPMVLTGIWPPLPIIMTNVFGLHIPSTRDPMPEDYDINSSIVDPNHVREIHFFHLTRSSLQRLASATRIQEQFPALTHLILSFDDSHPASALPDGFLGGSAPLLQDIGLNYIPFPSLPKLLLSATHLVRLILHGIPHSGYFSPEAIATGLAGMANLGCLFIKFESPLSRPHPEIRRPPPPTRTILPALTRFQFKGASEYLEDFVAQIDASFLNSIYITFFHQLIFDIRQLAQFMGRTTRFQELKEVHVHAHVGYNVRVDALPPRQTIEDSGLKILCGELDWQLSSVAQVFTSFFPSIYMVEHLYIYNEHRYRPQYDIENMQWLEIFHPFTAVKDLYLSEKSAPYIAPALQELVGGRTTEVLPMLQNIRLEGLEPSGPIPEGIQKFVAARELSGYPITVSRWEWAREPATS